MSEGVESLHSRQFSSVQEYRQAIQILGREVAREDGRFIAAGRPYRLQVTADQLGLLIKRGCAGVEWSPAAESKSWHFQAHAVAR